MKLPRSAVKAGLAGPGSTALLNPNAFVTPTPFGTPTPMPTMTPGPGSPSLGGTSTPVIGGIASIKFVVTPVGQRALPPTVLPIGPGQNCASTAGTMQCTLIEPLAPGNYTTTVAVYGGPNAGGPVLGPVQTIAFAVSAQKQNAVMMAIGGAPDALVVTGASFAVHPAANNGYTIYSENPQPFIAMVQDGTGDTIVGPGSPTFNITAAAVSGGAWQVTGPSPQAPSTLTIDPPATLSTANVTVTAQYVDQTCAQAGAVCSTTFPVANDLQMLFVANCTGSCNSKSSGGVPGSVTMYAPPYSGAPTATILSGVVQPIALLTDSNLNLYVANAFGGNSNAGSVSIYASPYTAVPTTVTTGVNNPGAIALDPNGNLWVANQAGNGLNGTITEYTPPFLNGPVRTISNFTGVPTGLQFDPQGNLFLANGSALLEYAAPYSGVPAIVISGLSVANGFSFDAASNLYYVDSNGAVSLYTPPYTEPPMQLQRVSGTLGLLATFQAGGMLFVPDAAGSVQQYVAPFTGPPQGIAQSSSTARGIAVDGAGNVFVGYCGSGCGNAGTDSVTIYSPPYTGGQTAITSGISAPSAITLSR
ncbi:MAG TPA: hypothetical protein VK760_02245 [Candidatus Acidoferrales bacterium]|nr:hypothetical protein [Candidatus Acidoferrales bacterium]